MRNLDLINPPFAKPNSLCSVGAIVPFISSVGALALVNGVSDSTSISKNILLIFFGVLAFISFCLFFIPRIFKWDWSGKYFFFSSLELACFGLVGIVPWLCFLVYSTLPLLIKIFIFALHFIVVFSLSYKFIDKYLEVGRSPNLIDFLYQVEDDKIFYIQKNDIFLIEKKFSLSFFPRVIYFLLFSILALGLIPFANKVTVIIGLPFTHIFLGVASIPVSMMVFAFLTRAWMVFFHLPKNFKLGKRSVYVDMSTKSKLKK